LTVIEHVARGVLQLLQLSKTPTQAVAGNVAILYDAVQDLRQGNNNGCFSRSKAAVAFVHVLCTAFALIMNPVRG
jgi:hypothetical protein